MHDEPPVRWLNEQEMEAWFALLELLRRLPAALEQQFAGSQVSGADYQVLAPLTEAPGGQMRPRDLAAAMGWDRSRLAHHLRRMEGRGLISREDSRTDGRGTVVRLTEAGQDAIDRAAPGHVRWVRAHIMDVLTPAELGQLAALSRLVVAHLDDPTE